MEHLYNFEINQIIFLQQKLSGMEFLFNLMNQLTSPSMFYLLFLPMLAGYDRVLFGKAFLSGIISEYLNIILKYYMAEDRPYWWLPENELEQKRNLLHTSQVSNIVHGNVPKPKCVLQNRYTCELSAGFPATELSFLAAVLYVIGQHVMSKIPCQKNVKSYVWAGYFSILFIVSLSKMFLGTHFFHQLLIGINLGMFIGSIASTNEFYIMAFNMKRNDVMLTCLSVFVFNFITYWMLLIVGVDPQWTVKKAFEHCQKIDFLNPESLPTYSLIRSFGMLLAFGNALPIYKRYRLEMNIVRSIPISLGILFGGIFIYQFVPRHYGVVPFYLCTLLLFFMMYYSLLTLLPKYCCPKFKVFSEKKVRQTPGAKKSSPMRSEGYSSCTNSRCS